MTLLSVSSIKTMNEELKIRCQSAGLEFQCGCDGLFNATIALVAEAPGDRECQLKSPLVGGSGKYLFECLRKQGLSRNHVYITNVFKRKLVSLADGHTTKPSIGKHEIEHWEAILRDELSMLPNLRYIIAFGGYALKALTKQTPISKWRGSVLQTTINDKSITVIVVNNPAFVMHSPKEEIVFRMDIDRIKKVLNGKHRSPTFIERINPSVEEAIDYLRSCRDAGSKGTAISYDIETLGSETACIGVAPSNTEGMCINFRDQRNNRYTTQDERRIRVEIQGLLGDRQIKFITQNGNFDTIWLWYKDRIHCHGSWLDTMLAHHVLYPSLPHNLGFLTSQYTDHPFYKDDGKSWNNSLDPEAINEYWRYNVKDCCITRIIAYEILNELREQNMEQFYFSHVARLTPHLSSMTMTGIKADQVLKAELNERIGIKVEEKRREFLQLARTATCDDKYECNPLSPDALSELFFNKLKLVGRGPSTDEENRKRMQSHPRTSDVAKRMLSTLDEFKKDYKFHSTYVGCTIDPDGRFRCEFKQTGVQSAPGRLSSAQTPWDSGMNLQNQTEESKKMFIADEGFEFSYFDAAQIEARIVGWLAPVPKWIEQFELARLNPGAYDAHCALAAEMWKLPYDQVPREDYCEQDGVKVKTKRYIAKRCRHGLNYRMGPDRLASTAGLSIREAAEAYRIYHRTTPEIMQWWDNTINEVRTNRCLYNCYGRRWQLLERLTDAALESVVAFKPQSTAGDHISRCIYLCHDDPDWPPQARIILNIHDALVALNRPQDGEQVRAIMKKHAESPIIINSRPLIIPCDLAKSVADEFGFHRWSSLKKIKPVQLPIVVS